MKIAIVYDRVNKLGGAERVLSALTRIWPQAPVYTLVADKRRAAWAAKISLKTSFLNNIPFLRTRHEFLPVLAGFFFQNFDFSEFEIVISVTSAEAKNIITKPKTLHICYCLTPTRYLWSGFPTYLKNPGFGWLNWLARLLLIFWAPILRANDFMAGQKVDKIVSISQTVRSRVKKYYSRESEVIYPPLFLAKTINAPEEDFFLVVSRLVPYKNIDLVINVFNQLGWNLRIIGTGSQEKKLKKIAKDNIKFLGQTTEDQLYENYSRCRALIMPQEEDFGLVSLEAQSFGKPVIALAQGGARETILAGKTGLFFQKAQAKDLKLALYQFNKLKFKPSACKENACRFSLAVFEKTFKKYVEDEWTKHQKYQLK